MRFRYVVTVDCASRQRAARVVTERLGFDEDYGFPYTVEYEFDGIEDEER